MGGRGASAGRSVLGNEYGTQYSKEFEFGAVKYVRKNKRDAESLMETMTKGRIYAILKGEDVGTITMFDNKNKRAMVFEYDKRRKEWHKHYGYEHNEYSAEAHNAITEADKQRIDAIINAWYNHKHKK